MGTAVENSDPLSFLLPDMGAFDNPCLAKSDVKPCPPTPKRIRRTPFNAELDDPVTLLSFSAEDGKKRSSSFNWETTIGVGALNEGWSVASKETGEKSALLKSKQQMASLSERQVLMAAFKNLERLLLSNGTWHPHILTHYSLWQEGGYLLLHAELCEKGDIGRLFDTKALRGQLVESDIWEVIKQMLPTIHFMHSRGVLHMDIKPANIYVTRDDVMKLGDFGTSVYCDYWEKECDMHEGDAGYLAVEVLRDHCLSPAADIFSFGMTLHRLVTGYCVSTSAISDKSSILKKPRFPLSDHLSQIILAMVQPNVQDRVRSDQLMSRLGLLSFPEEPLVPSEPFVPVAEMQTSSSLETSSFSSSSSSSSMVVSKSPLPCVRRIILSPKTPTERAKRKRRTPTRRRSSLRDL